MKNLVKFLNILLMLNTSLNAQIEYRKATEEDTTALMEIYAQFDELDKHNLLLFPIQIREAVLRDTLKKGRMYVATDEGKIVSFAKVYFLSSDDERKEIMRGKELRINLEEKDTKCLAQGMYAMNESMVNDFSTQLELLPMSSEALISYNQVYAYDVPCAYVYVGGMYTIREYRQQRINTKILQFALQSICNQVVSHLDQHPECKRIALLYGQVDANAQQKIQIRPFFELVMNVCKKMKIDLEDSINVLYAAYLSYKPEIVMEHDKPVFLLNVEANKGQGNILLINLER